MTEMKHEASLAIKSDEICDLIKISKTTLWKLQKDPSANFPKPIPFFRKAKVWNREEIVNWFRSATSQAHT